MTVDMTCTTIGNVLTRTTGYLTTVTSHSLQPYRGCTLGNSLCGVGCYVRQNGHVLKGRRWGGFLEVRTNAADSYRKYAERERRWARERRGRFAIFMSSATEPFLPQERRYHVTGSVLATMLESPPDELVVQTHSPLVTAETETLRALALRCRLRVHMSIESDRDRLPGLPRSAYSVQQRLDACGALRSAGLRTVATVSPLLPIDDPRGFFRRLSEVCDAVVIDHFIGGDGSASGARTRRTGLPDAMAAVQPRSDTLAYRDEVVAIAREEFDGDVGVSIDGFAGRYLTD